MNEEQKFDPAPRRWWLSVSVLGSPTLVEIVAVNEEPCDHVAPPKFGRDDEVEVDRILMPIQVPNGVGCTDMRMRLDPVLAPQDNDFQPKANRRPLYMKGASLCHGPYSWVDIHNPANQAVMEQFETVYGPRSLIEAPSHGNKPVIAGPGALDALRGVQR